MVALQGDPGQGIPDEEPSRRLGQTNVERPLESADQFDQKQDEVLPKQKKQASQTGRPLLLESKADRRVKRASRAKVEKKKTWYHDQIAKANMPTSVISEEALEAGRRYGIHGVGNKKSAVQKPTTPKPKQQGGKRVRKPELDPSKGFALSNQAADMLIASGFVKESVAARTAVPALSTSLVANPGTVLTGIPVSEHSLYVPGPGPRPNQVSSSQEISNAAASLQALAQDYGNSGNAPAATLAPTVTTPVTEGKAAASGWLDDDTEEESSSRDNDDPNDASFGKRYTGRKKGNPQKSIGPARKRKSAGATTPAKRSRLSVDGGLGGAADVLCDTLEDTPL